VIAALGCPRSFPCDDQGCRGGFEWHSLIGVEALKQAFSCRLSDVERRCRRSRTVEFDGATRRQLIMILFSLCGLDIAGI